MSFAFRLGIVADCPPYAAVNRRWPSFSGRRPLYVEQSSAARHVSTATGHLLQLPQDSSLQALLSMTLPFSCRAREVTCHYGHVNRFCYLLTYLLTYHLAPNIFMVAGMSCFALPCFKCKTCRLVFTVPHFLVLHFRPAFSASPLSSYPPSLPITTTRIISGCSKACVNSWRTARHRRRAK